MSPTFRIITFAPSFISFLSHEFEDWVRFFFDYRRILITINYSPSLFALSSGALFIFHWRFLSSRLRVSLQATVIGLEQNCRDAHCSRVQYCIYNRLRINWRLLPPRWIYRNEREEVLERRILSNLTREMIAFLRMSGKKICRNVGGIIRWFSEVCLNKRVCLEDGNAPAEAEDEADGTPCKH